MFLTWYRDALTNNVADLVLSDFTVEPVAGRLGHCRAEDNVVSASSLRDLWLLSRKEVSSTVLPLQRRLYGRKLSPTLQQDPRLCDVLYLGERTGRCPWKQQVRSDFTPGMLSFSLVLKTCCGVYS